LRGRIPLIRNSIAVARRVWLEKENVVNALPLKEFLVGYIAVSAEARERQVYKIGPDFTGTD
jgi:hypothetical protein